MPARVQSPQAVIQGLSEVFREYGFAGASLAHISAATGLGKGSLYHAFPGGKEEMARVVLNDIDTWFENHVFQPLGDKSIPPALALDDMLQACRAYFHCGGRVCLVGVFALSDTRDTFGVAVNGYFLRWNLALVAALCRGGVTKAAAKDLAEEILSRIQGGLVLARAFDDKTYFEREIKRLSQRLKSALEI